MVAPLLLGVTLAGGALSAISSIARGRQAAAIRSYQAAVARQQARDAIEAGKLQERDFRRKAAQITGRQAALYGAAGVEFEGSPELIQLTTLEEAELNSLIIRQNALLRSQSLEQSAGLLVESGRQAKTAGLLAGVTDIATTFATPGVGRSFGALLRRSA